MNILFLFVSLPNLSDEYGLYSSLIHEFNKNMHKVFVSTKGNKIDETKIENEAGIPVLRIKSNDFTGVSNNIKKAFAYQEYIIKQYYYIKKYWGKEKIDLIFSHSLPPEIAYVVIRLKKLFHCKFYLEVSDFTWQDAVAFGFFKKNGLVGLYYRFWEHKMFFCADYIGVPTKGNVQFILNIYSKIEKNKFRVFPFWQKKISVEKDNSLKSNLGLNDKFIVIYGGSIGAAQRCEHIVELAESIKDYEHIVFLILGKGTFLESLKNFAEQKKLNNIIFKDFLPKQEYLQLLSVCDVGLIILNEKNGSPNFPSKTMSYFNLQIPVLAAIDYVTDFGQFLDDTGTGLWSYSDNIEQLKNKLIELYDNEKLRKEIKMNQKFYFEKYMNPQYAYNCIINQIIK